MPGTLFSMLPLLSHRIFTVFYEWGNWGLEALKNFSKLAGEVSLKGCFVPVWQQAHFGKSVLGHNTHHGHLPDCQFSRGCGASRLGTMRLQGHSSPRTETRVPASQVEKCWTFSRLLVSEYFIWNLFLFMTWGLRCSIHLHPNGQPVLSASFGL